MMRMVRRRYERSASYLALLVGYLAMGAAFWAYVALLHCTPPL